MMMMMHKNKQKRYSLQENKQYIDRQYSLETKKCALKLNLLWNDGQSPCVFQSLSKTRKGLVTQEPLKAV